MEPVLELPIRLPGKGSRRLLRNLHQQLRAAILDGRLQPGLRMPSTRAFAMHLRVSRNTAIASYDLLLSEGYLTSRPGAGDLCGRHATAPKTAKEPRHGSRRRRTLGHILARVGKTATPKASRNTAL
jgi:GntR family transcriptional regulator/MocR family aminotransferase